MPRPAYPPGSAAYFKEGTIARDFTDKDSGLRGLVLRGPYSWCGYVGVPTPHALEGLEELQFDCHWGVTFSGPGDGVLRPSGYHWYGWDYAHGHDRQHWPEELADFLGPAGLPLPFSQGKDWTVDEVAEDVLDVLMNLRRAVEQNSALAREILLKTMPAEPSANNFSPGV